MTFVKIPRRQRSWHVFRTWTRVPNQVRTACNRNILDPEVRDGLPSGPTCESCARSGWSADA